MMMNHSTNALFFDNMGIPASSLVGQEGKGFSYILDGMNAERILVASDSLGDARWFIEKAVAYSSQRVIFGKPIGANQGVQFPIAKAHMAIEAAATPAWTATEATASQRSTTSSASTASRASTAPRRSTTTSSWPTSGSTSSACRARTETTP
jgi:acyl-CoA dehydrogenase